MVVTGKLDDVPPDTDRLAFREWNDDDLDRFHAICSDPKVMKFVGDGQAWTKDRTGQFIQSASDMLQEHGYCQWPMIHKADGTLIVRFEKKPRKDSLPGKFQCLTAILLGLIKELGPFGFTFRYLGESLILGDEVQLGLQQLSVLSRGHGHAFSSEKCWSVAVRPQY